MSTELDETAMEAEPREKKSRVPCIVLPIVGLFVLLLCYVTFVIVHNISPTSARQAAERQGTATAITAKEASAGATVAAEMQADATQTALLAPSPIATAPPGTSPQTVPTPTSGPAP
jgi:hypothetical protein